MHIKKPKLNQAATNEIKRIYQNLKEEIEKRLKSFSEFGRQGTKKEIFTELAFCLLTPQSKARDCWRAVENMVRNGTFFKGNAIEIQKYLKNVRFKYKKSEYIVSAREKFFGEENQIYSSIKNNEDPLKLRDYLVENIKGMGYKEASHFLRNIGIGGNLAILDRHILRNLQKLGIIEGTIKSCSVKKYREIEKKLIKFSKEVEIPLSHLDLTLWAKETGEVFK